MTGDDAINTESKAPEQHELSAEELNAVSGGSPPVTDAPKKQADAIKGFQQMLQELP